MRVCQFGGGMSETWAQIARSYSEGLQPACLAVTTSDLLQPQGWLPPGNGGL